MAALLFIKELFPEQDSFIPQLPQACAAKAVVVAFFNKMPLFCRKCYGAAVAIADIAYLTLEGGLATGAFLFFVFAHDIQYNGR